MLVNLHVKNLALIKDIDVDFNNGLIVLTGETGAGKSLLLGSVNIALGNKVSKEIIRTGEEYALVELTFKVSDECVDKLKELDVIFENDNIITVSRKITAIRSQSKINGETVSLNTLQAVMEGLVDIHGQHDHQSLLYTKNHLNILDSYAKNNLIEIKKQLAEHYSNYLKISKELTEINIDESQRCREIEFARFEINEIEAANLQIGEDEEVESLYKKLSNGQQIIDSLSNAYNCLGAENGAMAYINQAISSVNAITIKDEQIEQFQNTLYDIDSLCRDLHAEMYSYNESLEYDPGKVFELEQRLDVINKLKLKYGNSIEIILKYLDKQQQYLESMENYQEKIDVLTEKIEKEKTEILVLCEELSNKRLENAKKLEVIVTEALKDLNFIDVNFKIDLTKSDKFNENGNDIVEFMISTNPGEPLKSLSKVASGGELSRIMLAIKSILAVEDDIETLIFDEIDTGISGVTAIKVAEKLARIGKNHQVLCISHLAQIASMADEHFLIEKSSSNNSTETNLIKLNREQSIKELARINSGMEISEIAIKQATEMKEMADRTKCNLV